METEENAPRPTDVTDAGVSKENNVPGGGGEEAVVGRDVTITMTPEQQARAKQNRERALEILARKESESVAVAAVRTPEDSAVVNSVVAHPDSRTAETAARSLDLVPKKLFVANPYAKRVDPYRKAPVRWPVKKKKLYPVFCVDSTVRKENMGSKKHSEFDDEAWEKAAMKHMDEYELDKMKNNKVKPVKPASKEVSGLAVISIGHRYNCDGVKMEKFKCEIGVKGFQLNFNLDEPVKKLTPRLKCECGVFNCDCDSS